MTEKEDRSLTSREAAYILDVSPDTVNELARKRILPGYKQGRRWRFSSNDVAMFKRQLHGATAA